MDASIDAEARSFVGIPSHDASHHIIVDGEEACREAHFDKNGLTTMSDGETSVDSTWSVLRQGVVARRWSFLGYCRCLFILFARGGPCGWSCCLK